MPIRIVCDNKGCFQDSEALLDTSTNEVYCSKCNKVIKSATEFAKKQLKTFGQILKNVKDNKAFSVQCKACGRVAQPLLEKGRIICSGCKKDITDTLSAPMAHGIRLALGGKLNEK